ncbi:MAG: mechanosensitive ion channel family protein, partial [Balneolaceae bacterium]
LLWKKPFEVGDRIQVADDRGDVIDIRLFKFSLLEIGNWVHADQSTGRVVHIPNRMIFAHSIANYTSQIEFIWNEIEVIVTFESDWRRAKTVLEEIAEELLGNLIQDAEQQVKRRSVSYLIHYQFLTPIVYSEVVGNGVRLTLRHLTHPRSRRSTNMLIWEEILTRFEKEQKIDYAYETVRIYRNPKEGKPGLRNKPG